MNIIDYALQMEKDGEAYYRDLAAQVENASIKQVFNILADAEAEHYETFLQMKENQPITRKEGDHISRIKNLFTEMKAQGDQDIHTEQIAAYAKAMEVEKKSQETYQQKAEEISDPEQKSLCLKIADEERKHYVILENMIELLQHPATWVEDAEWRNMEDY